MTKYLSFFPAHITLINNDEYDKMEKTDELVNRIRKYQSVQVLVTLHDLKVFKPRNAPGLILGYGVRVHGGDAVREDFGLGPSNCPHISCCFRYERY